MFKKKSNRAFSVIPENPVIHQNNIDYTITKKYREYCLNIIHVGASNLNIAIYKKITFRM